MPLTVGLPISPSPFRPASMPNMPSAAPGLKGTLVCKKCQTRVASQRSVLSWSFRGHKGKAALFTRVSNVTLDKPTVLLMDSGAHTVREFSCQGCTTLLGWKIVRAHESPEKWKEGYSVLELALLQERQSQRTSPVDLAPPSPHCMKTTNSLGPSPSPLPRTRTSAPIKHSSSSTGSEYDDLDLSEDEEGDTKEPEVAAFHACLQVASALSKAHKYQRATSNAEVRRSRPAGPRALTVSALPGTITSHSVGTAVLQI